MSEPIDFPVNLDRIVVLRSVVESVMTFNPAAQNVPEIPSLGFRLDINPDNSQQIGALMQLVINQGKSSNCPYHIEIECAANFRVKDSISQAQALEIVGIVAQQSLYGSIREFVLSITSRHVNGPYMLGLLLLQPPIVHPPNPEASPALDGSIRSNPEALD